MSKLVRRMRMIAAMGSGDMLPVHWAHEKVHGDGE